MPVSLRSPRPDDATAFCDAVMGSRALHHPWVSPPCTPDAFSAFIQKYEDPANACFLAVNEDDELVGCINLNEIIRGPFKSAYLGYYVFVPFDSKGLMKQALSLAVAEAFGQLGLHRLEANIQPGNKASLALVRSLGFRHEGYSPRYLFIDGQWRDHERFAMTIEDWSAS